MTETEFRAWTGTSDSPYPIDQRVLDGIASAPAPDNGPRQALALRIYRQNVGQNIRLMPFPQSGWRWCPA